MPIMLERVMHAGQLQAAQHLVTTDLPLTSRQSEKLSLGTQ